MSVATDVPGRLGTVSALMEWPVRLVVLNLLWLLGVLAGAVIGGIAPATLALHLLLRAYLRGDPVHLWPDFWAQWRAEWARAQLVVGLPILTLLVVAFYVFAARETVLAVAALLLAFGYGVTVLQLPATVAHLDLPAGGLWKATLALAWRQPGVTVGVGVLLAGALVVCWLFAPAAVVFLVPAVPALLGTLIVRRGLRRLGADV